MNGIGTRLRRFMLVAVGVAISAATLSFVQQPANAGSAVDELQFRYRCSVDKRWMEMDTGISRYRVTVELASGPKRSMRLIADESIIREHAFEVVAFEYFSACELATLVSHSGSWRALANGGPLRAELVEAADCLSIRRMAKEGLLRGYREFDSILKVFEFQRAKREYYGVSFERRASHLRRNCPP
ncbi:MAG: hypothetical protein AB3N20_14815 [Rhizobiaceae bacterium]